MVLLDRVDEVFESRIGDVSGRGNRRRHARDLVHAAAF
jgi:hypothetical protein